MKGRELVAWNVRALRVARGLTQERLAVDAGLARTYVGEVERAQKGVTVDVLDQLAAALDVPPADLLRAPQLGEQAPAVFRGGRRKGWTRGR
jgi:transcriptional regulator with XRE-family HTH domain